MHNIQHITPDLVEEAAVDTGLLLDEDPDNHAQP